MVRSAADQAADEERDGTRPGTDDHHAYRGVRGRAAREQACGESRARKGDCCQSQHRGERRVPRSEKIGQDRQDGADAEGGERGPGRPPW